MCDFFFFERAVFFFYHGHDLGIKGWPLGANAAFLFFFLFLFTLGVSRHMYRVVIHTGADCCTLVHALRWIFGVGRAKKMDYIPGVGLVFVLEIAFPVF